VTGQPSMAPGGASRAGRSAALGDSDAPSLDDLLDQLEAVLQRLADPAAPLDQAVSDYERAGRLLGAAEARMEAAARRVAELELGRS
jgi:exodeoxyribonuclease VII small subunit